MAKNDKSDSKDVSDKHAAAVENYSRELAADAGVTTGTDDDSVIVFDGFGPRVVTGDDAKAAADAAKGGDGSSVTKAFLPVNSGVNRARVTEDGEVIPAATATDGATGTGDTTPSTDSPAARNARTGS